MRELAVFFGVARGMASMTDFEKQMLLRDLILIFPANRRNDGDPNNRYLSVFCT